MRPIKKSKIITANIIDTVGKILFCFRKRRDIIPLQTSSIQSILVVELFNIGDVVLALPAISELRRLFPYASITFLGGPWSKDLLDNNPDINELITLTVPWVVPSASWVNTWKIARQLKKRNFDLALDLRGDFRNIIFLYGTGAKERIASASTGGGFLLTRIVPDTPVHLHDVEHKLDVVKMLGNISDEIKFPFSFDLKDIEMVKKDLNGKGILPSDVLIGVHPGGRWYGRQWRPQRFAQAFDTISQRPNIKFIIFGGPDDKSIIEDIMRLSKSNIIPLFTTLKQLPLYISQCNLFLCNESGPMHIAAALNIPVIALFGPNLPDVLGPYGKNNTVLMAENVPCRPCQQTVCTRPEQWCMDMISVQEVIQTIVSKLDCLKGSSH